MADKNKKPERGRPGPDLRKELASRDAVLKRLFDIEAAILNTSRDGILFVTRPGKVIEVNPAFCEIAGIPRDQLINKSVIPLVKKFVTRSDVLRVLKVIRDYLLGRNVPVLELVYRGKIIEVITPKVSAGSRVLLAFIRDITERKKLESDLEESRFRYKTISELTTEYIFRLKIGEDGSASVDYTSDNYSNQTGRDPDSIRSPQSWSNLFDSASNRKVQESLASLVRKGGETEFEILSSTKDGKERWVSVFARAISGGTGSTTAAIIGAVRNITARKLVEQALRESEKKFKAAFEDGPFGMCIVAMDGRFLDVNPAFCAMLGYTESELKSRTFRHITHPADLASSDDWVQRLVDGNPDTIELEKRYLHKNGNTVWGIVKSRLFRRDDGTPEFFVTHVQDITARKSSEEALRASEIRLKSILENLPDIVFMLDRSERILFLNERAAGFLGIRPGEAVGTLQSVYFPRGEGILNSNRISDVFRTGQAVRSEREMTAPGGGQFWLEAFLLPLTDPASGISAVLGILRDVTERKMMEEELLRSEKLSAVGQLAAGIAHEFNNILAVMSGHLELAQMNGPGAEPSSYRTTFDVLEKQVERAREMIAQMMAFARPADAAKERTDLGKLLDDIYQLQKKQIEIENIEVKFNVVEPPVMAEVNPGHIQQVFLNLFLNARHAIIPKGRGSILIDLRRIGDMVRIKFSDDGIGMDPRTRKNVFMPFFTTKGAYSRDGHGISGTGLGLSVSHSIIERHQGSISFVTEEGKGTTFTIFLPVIGPEAKNAAGSASAAGASLEKIKKMRILIVDDELQLLKVMEKIFKSAGCSAVSTASSGKEALELLGKSVFDLILLDLRLPGMSGEEILSSIRSTGKKVKVILITGNLDVSDADAARMGADGLIRKPFDISDVALAVGKLDIPPPAGR